MVVRANVFLVLILEEATNGIVTVSLLGCDTVSTGRTDGCINCVQYLFYFPFKCCNTIGLPWQPTERIDSRRNLNVIYGCCLCMHVKCRDSSVVWFRLWPLQWQHLCWGPTVICSVAMQIFETAFFFFLPFICRIPVFLFLYIYTYIYTPLHDATETAGISF